MAIDLILGTAGHIDHGKTALVRALTGTDTDRLPEEKRRGITIELGFAQLPLDNFRLGIVDVPGHEKFVRQMLAGATGIDLAMLVVAADDSVKQQTREHVEVLRMLNISAGVIALTKCDLADSDWTELVEAEVRELVQDSFLADAPIIHTSAVSGEGIDELKQALSGAAKIASESLDATAASAPFRLAIDRTFTMAGHGTVVTGSVVSGTANVGDELAIQPGDLSVRVRGIQNHDLAVDSVQRGQRAAINLAGIHHEEIRRGHELVAIDHLSSSQLLTVELKLLGTSPRPLKHRSHVRVHVGTAEVLATVSLLNQTKLEPGTAAIAQLYLREPVATSWNQPFVLRSESPVETIGGGHVLVPVADKLKNPAPQVFTCLNELRSDDPLVRTKAALFFNGLRPWKDDDLVRLAGTTNSKECADQLVANGDLIRLVVSPTRTARLEKRLLDHWAERLMQTLKRAHETDSLKIYVDRSRLLSSYAYVGDPALLDAIVAWMHKQKLVRQTDLGVALTSHAPQLSKKQQVAIDQIVERFRAAAFQPPSPAECNDVLPNQEKEVAKLIKLATTEGRLVHISKQIYLHHESATQMKALLRQSLGESEGMTLSEIRELLATSRKYAVPICEHLDRIGFTKRKGDLRVLV